MADAAEPEATPTPEAEAKTRRRIPGNLTYLTNYGAIERVLQKVQEASTPEKFTQDYLATVLGLAGGGYKAAIPVLKRVGYLSSDGTPTELYSKFRTGSGRPEAAYQALRNGFAEVFKRNEHAYAANDNKLTDYIVEITGLAKDDPIVGAARGTFKVFSSLLPPGFNPASTGKQPAPVETENYSEARRIPDAPPSVETPEGRQLGLTYNINIVLPESKDIEVFNVIFRSLRDNLLRA